MDWRTGTGTAAAFLAALYIFAPLGICWFTLRRNKLAEIPPPLQQIVHRFEWRASSRQCGSHAILALILGLLAAAAWVFIQAKEITAQETGGDLSQKLIQRTEKRNADVREHTRLKEDLTAAVKPIADLIGQEYHTGGQVSFPIELPDSNGIIREPGIIFQEIITNISRGYTSARVQLTLSGQRTNPAGLLEKYPILDFDRLITPTDLPKLDDGKHLWEPKDLSSLINQFDRVTHDLEIDNAAIFRISSEIRASEIGKATGEEPTTSASGNLSLPFLLQLNITRFGTITLVSIAIGILVPLYRFSERLSAFYRARCDALRLHQAGGYKTVGIMRLSTMLTPNIDYGKSQNMPDNWVEMLRLIGRTDQEK